VSPPDPALIDLAGDLGLDGGRFSACLNSRRPLERVVNDLLDAQGVAGSTPTFVAIQGGRGSVIRGSRPADQFVTLLQGLLKPAEN
jgi:predicted DsbA family dithiol-disulfide isomerase